MEKFTKEQMAEAIRIALEGGNPKEYLRSIGSTSPDNLWYYMKGQLRKNDPETYEQLAKVTGAKKPAEKAPIRTVSAKEVAEAITMAPPPEPIVNINTFDADGFRICGVRGQLGSWHFEGKVMDYSGINGDELYMPVEDWKLFLKELRKAAAMLGVEL